MSSVPRTYGHVDWKPRLGVWRVIWYVGAKHVPSGDYATQVEAADALRAKVNNRNNLRKMLQRIDAGEMLE